MAAAGNRDSKNENYTISETQQSRDELINTAVRFLLTPKIQNSPANLKRKFLLNKGLSETEVDVAFERAGLSVSQESQFSRHVAVNVPPAAQLWQPQPRSTWHWIRDVANTVTALGGLFYAIYWVWKTYIYPYFFGNGKPKRKSVETSIADLESTVATCVTDLKTGMQTVHNALDTLAEQRSAEITNGILVSRLQEVKSEVSSLKGLLLNRSQFPPTPVSTLPLGPASIPSWQLHESLKEEEGSKELEEDATGSGSEGTTNNGSDSSSLEMIKE